MFPARLGGQRRTVTPFGEISLSAPCKHCVMRALEILSANLHRLMLEAGNPSSGLAVDKAAKALGLSIGRTSVTRYSHAEGNPTLDHLEMLAKVFGVQAWQLLHPTLGTDSEQCLPSPPPLFRVWRVVRP